MCAPEGMVNLVPGAQVERYVVEAKIGAGAMTTTWRARHVALDTLHTLSLPNQVNPALHARMVAGARIQARLRRAIAISALTLCPPWLCGESFFLGFSSPNNGD